MGFLDRLRQAFAGGSGHGPDAHAYWLYVQCERCGEPLRARIDLRNEPSEEEDGTFIVRKALMGSGDRRCFQTVEVMLHFNNDKTQVLDSEVSGGRLIAADEYQALMTRWQLPQEQEDDA